MAYYFQTDAFSAWNVADPAFPDELPEAGERVYCAIVDGPIGQKSTKALSQVYERQFWGVEWLQNWYKELHSDYGPNATIIWVKIPPKPLLPEEWKVCGPSVCEEHTCPSYDNCYCMSDDGERCPKAKIHKEFSIIRPAKRPQKTVPAADEMISPNADVYNLAWRNAYIYTVDWEQRKMAVRIGEDIWHLLFDDISYSATDDTQALKMILDRLVIKTLAQTPVFRYGVKPLFNKFSFVFFSLLWYNNHRTNDRKGGEISGIFLQVSAVP